MLNITDNKYSLPVIFAIEGIKVFGTGTTQPMLIRGIDEKTNEKGEYVIKFKSGPRMTPESSCREFIAACIGKELNLNVVEPVIINVTEDFVKTLLGKEGYKNALNSLGINFGSKHEPGYWEFTKNQLLTDKQIKEAQRIFAFDIFISNPDRRLDKPNMLTNGENVLIFDHELAFDFVLQLFKNKTPWQLRPEDKEWIKRHYFFSILKGNENEFEEFVSEFGKLTPNFWEKLKSIIPKEWQTDQIDEIKDYLTSLISHKESFIEELNQVTK